MHWIERSLGRGARIVGRRRLTGGITSAVHRLTVEQRGRRTSYVLRQWPADSDDGARAVASEVAVLTALANSDIPAPRLVAATSDAVLMTRVPGRVHLMPRDREAWLGELVRMLVRIHAVPIAGKPFETWWSTPAVPSDATRPALWRKAAALVATPRLPQPTCFIHRDYQHFNVLWARERLTGVVDWIEACAGPPDVDVGHCRLNLALLFSPEIAERFLERYEAEAGRRVDPYWDIQELLAYGDDWKRFLPIQIDGRAPLDRAGMTRRVEIVLARALRRS